MANWAKLGSMVSRGASFSGRERNRCFLNTRGGPRFADVSSVAGLDLLDDGRGIAVVDWDHDGDLDLWMSNRTAPRVRMMRNETSEANHYVAFQLHGKRCNRDAIGARVQLILRQVDESIPRSLVKTLRAGEGFLSQSSKWVHFGLGAADQIEEVRVFWPDPGPPQVFKRIAVDQRYLLTQDDPIPTPATTHARGQQLTTQPAAAAPASDSSRTLLTRRLPIPDLGFDDAQSGESADEALKGPLLILVWASWCAPCLDELSQLTQHEASLRAKDLRVLALSVDRVQPASTRTESTDLEILRQIGFPFTTATASEQQLRKLTDLTHQIFYPQKPLSLPCSFLVDATGKVAAFYRGSVTVDQLLADLDLLTASRNRLAESAFPFPGRRLLKTQEPSALSVAEAYLEGGYYELARKHVLDHLKRISALKDFDRLAAVLNESIRPGVSRQRGNDHQAHSDQRGQRLTEALKAEQRRHLASGLRLLADVEQKRKSYDGLEKALRRLVQLNPGDFQLQTELAVVLAKLDRSVDANRILSELRSSTNADAQIALGRVLMQIGKPEEAERSFQRAVQLDSGNVEARFSLAMAKQIGGEVQPAVEHYQWILSKQPEHHEARNNLAWLFATTTSDIRDPDQAVQMAKRLCQDTNFKTAAYLDTLAAALAETGSFDSAVKVTATAYRIARGSDNAELASRLKQRLTLYQAGKSVSESAREAQHSAPSQ